MSAVHIFLLFIAAFPLVYCLAKEREHSKELDAGPLHTFWKPSKVQFTCPAIYGRYPHKTDCEYFYECRYGWPHLMHCNTGYLYDVNKQQCRPRNQVRCHKDIDDNGGFKPKENKFICPAYYGRYPHPTDCDYFYECRFGLPYLMHCTTGYLYDKRKEQCREKNTVKCGNDDESGEEEDDGPFKCPYPWGTFAHPKDCSKYYICIYNLPTLYKCYEADLYDANLRRCVDKRKVNCGNRFDRNNLKTSKRPTTAFTTPITKPEVVTEEEGRFHCPFPYGRYPDPQDCSQFYACHFSKSTLEKCANGTLYNERKEQCQEANYVKCGDRPGGIDNGKDENKDKEEFRCPYIWGTFPHPDDCSKYIICIYDVPTIFSCRKTELFHAKYRRCFPSEFVTCDYRINPDDLTNPPRLSTKEMTSPTTRPKTNPITTTRITTTSTTTKTLPTTTPATTTTSTTTTTPAIATMRTTTTSPTTTTTQTITTARTTTSATTTTAKTVGTKKPKPNTPPPTDCNEDDVDCILDKTKDVKGWFDCPERYGHFPHAASYQLFIHCDNWRPFIKKCAEHTVFSPKYLVCMWLGKGTFTPAK